jgi:superfamily I DNA/RNA helicase
MVPLTRAAAAAWFAASGGYRNTVEILTAQAVPTVLLKSDRANAEGVKVGTWFRSKGMEYAHVFLPQIDRTTMLHTGAGQLARDEKAELMRRTLYVAMTRARDTLWTGQLLSTSNTQPPVDARP